MTDSEVRFKIMEITKEIFLAKGAASLYSFAQPSGSKSEEDFEGTIKRHEDHFARNFNHIFNCVKDAYDQK